MKKLFLLVVVILTVFMVTNNQKVYASDKVLYSVSDMKTIAKVQNELYQLGSLVVTFDMVEDGEHNALIALPKGYTVVVPGELPSIKDPHIMLSTSVSGQPNEFNIHYNQEGVKEKVTFEIPIKARIPLTEEGNIVLNIKRAWGDFVDGEVVIGRIAKGEVLINNKVTYVKAVRPDMEIPFSIVFDQETKDALSTGNEILEIVLPSGFNWVSSSLQVEQTNSGGILPAIRLDEQNNKRIWIDIQDATERTKGTFTVLGLIKAEKTLLPPASISVTINGKDLNKTYTLEVIKVSEPKVAASFTLGSDSYRFNGNSYYMDVYPYTKEGRVFLPLRYVGYSLGINPKNINWDGKTATLISDDTTVQITPGLKQIKVNEQKISVDVAAEVKEPGRLMLPYRFIAEAFGAEVMWDNETNTVIMEIE